MKFAALALTLLLAVGSHGDVWPGDKIKEELPQIVAVVKRIIMSLRGTEYEQQIPVFESSVDLLNSYITGFLDSDEAEQRYNNAKAKIDEVILKWEGSELRTTLLARYNDYRAIFDSFFQENEAAFLALKEKIQETIKNNHEETIRVLNKAVETVFMAVPGYVENLKAMASGQTEEYREHIKAVFDQVKGNFQETLEPNVQAIRENLVVILNTVYATLSSQQ